VNLIKKQDFTFNERRKNRCKIAGMSDCRTARYTESERSSRLQGSMPKLFYLNPVGLKAKCDQPENFYDELPSVKHRSVHGLGADQ
jgi:hypothetical protein